jgi:hypothetical protein
MEKLPAHKMISWFFKDYKYVDDLIDFEGPVLVHYAIDNKHAFYYWVEGDVKANRWLCFEVTLLEMYDYLQGSISLYELILHRPMKLTT